MWRQSHTNFILAKFCDENNTYPQILSELAEKNAKFSEALKRAKAHQEAVIAEGGLTGEFNPAVTIFSLKNVAGWRDEQKHEWSGNVTVELVSYASEAKDTPAP